MDRLSTLSPSLQCFSFRWSRQGTELAVTVLFKKCFVHFLHLLRDTTWKLACKSYALILKNCLSLNNSMGESTAVRVRLHSAHNLEFHKLYIQAMLINPLQRKSVTGH